MQFFDTKSVNNVLVVTLQPQPATVADTADAFREALLNLGNGGGALRMVVDFSAIRGLASETINSLLQLRKVIKAQSGQLRLCAMSPEVREVFRTMRLDTGIFQIHDSLDEAVRSIG